MVKVETSGLCHYQVCGDQEKAAAAELERVYVFLMRSHLSWGALLLELEEARQRIEKEYNVQIKIEI